MVMPALVVEAPTVVPYAGGLRDTVPIVSATNRLGGGLESDQQACGPASLAPGLCLPDPGIDVPDEKSADPLEPGVGFVFGVFKGVVCDLLGGDYDSQALEALDRGEYVAVAQAIAMKVLSGADELTATCAPVAVGLLEETTRSVGQQGVLLTNAVGANILVAARLAHRDGNHLVTELGTPVAVESEFNVTPGGATAAAADEAWVYALPSLVLYRGEAQAYQGPDPEHNLTTSIAERVWGVLIGCPGTASAVKVSC